jgi:hypothetical protein
MGRRVSNRWAEQSLRVAHSDLNTRTFWGREQGSTLTACFSYLRGVPAVQYESHLGAGRLQYTFGELGARRTREAIELFWFLVPPPDSYLDADARLDAPALGDGISVCDGGGRLEARTGPAEAMRCRAEPSLALWPSQLGRGRGSLGWANRGEALSRSAALGRPLHPDWSWWAATRTNWTRRADCWIWQQSSKIDD